MFYPLNIPSFYKILIKITKMNRKLNDTELEQFKNEVLNFKVIGLTQILNLRVKYRLTRNQTMGLIAKIVRNYIANKKNIII